MIRFLLADDEPHIRNWIERKADFEAAGISEFQAFDDGDTALAAFREQSFDILLTDVRMPRMDGPTLAEQARALNPDVVILFLSAYSDKEYYKTALHLHAATFIEKPIDLGELNRAIADAAEEVRRRRREIQNEDLTSMMRSGSVLWDLAEGRTRACPKELEHAETLTAVFSTRGDKPHGSSHELLLARMRETDLHGVFSLSDPEFNLYLFDSGREEFLPALSCFCREIYRLTGDRFAAGHPSHAPDNLEETFASARRNCDSLFFTSEPILLPGDVRPGVWRFPRETLARFAELLREGKQADCVSLINRITEELSQCQRTPVREVKEFYFRMLVSILEEQKRLDASKGTGEGNRYHWETVFLISSLFVLKNYLMENLEEYFETLHGLDSSESRYQEILHHIEENFRNPAFSLSDLGAMTYMSVPYLCTVFKSKSGMTVNGYLTERRMTEARRLLAQPDRTIVQIAREVGFSDQHYFSKRFAKFYGISPSKYREQLATGRESMP